VQGKKKVGKRKCKKFWDKKSKKCTGLNARQKEMIVLTWKSGQKGENKRKRIKKQRKFTPMGSGGGGNLQYERQHLIKECG